MARKNISTRKASSDFDDASEETAQAKVAAETTTNVTADDDSPPTKSKSKTTDEQSSGSNVGLSDIRKAVAFSNSVGGLDKAIAILQILKVAKEVQ